MHLTSLGTYYKYIYINSVCVCVYVCVFVCVYIAHWWIQYFVNSEYVFDLLDGDYNLLNNKLIIIITITITLAMFFLLNPELYYTLQWLVRRCLVDDVIAMTSSRRVIYISSFVALGIEPSELKRYDIDCGFYVLYNVPISS